MNKNNQGSIKTAVLIIIGVILATGFGVGIAYFVEKNNKDLNSQIKEPGSSYSDLIQNWEIYENKFFRLRYPKNLSINDDRFNDPNSVGLPIIYVENYSDSQSFYFQIFIFPQLYNSEADIKGFLDENAKEIKIGENLVLKSEGVIGYRGGESRQYIIRSLGKPIIGFETYDLTGTYQEDINGLLASFEFK